MTTPWILVSVAVLLVVTAAVCILVLKKRGWKRKMDYKGYFAMGVVWVPLGIAFWLIFENFVAFWFLIMGVIYIAIGLRHRDTWGKPQNVSPEFQRRMVMLGGVLVVVLVLGILVFELFLV